jgi:peptidoglycan-N-acetylglucosamine deacetylase
MKQTRYYYVILLCAVAGYLPGCSSWDRGGTDPYKQVIKGNTEFHWPEGKKAAVCLTFDDARPSQVDVGVPILDAQQVKATFYVSPPRLKERRESWQQTVAQGHEIGNHTLNHPCSGNFPWARHKALEDYTWEAIAGEMTEANIAIKKELGVHATTFAYPCGQKFIGRDRGVKSYVPLVAEMFIAGRGWRDENRNDPGYCDPAQLLGTELDGLTFEQAKKLIEQAKKEGSWLVFAGHDVGDPGKRQTVRADTLQAICTYCQDPANGIWIDTVESIARYIQGQRIAPK